MRIISGKYKGRTVYGYNITGTRPTMDRVKESVIAMIQNKIKDSIILDLFAGSGSVGLELISNGSKKGYFIDNNQKVIDTLKNNIKKLNITEECIVIKKDYQDFLKTTNEVFDIIFLDPPYKLNIINNALDIIYERNILKSDGLIICEYENESIKTDKYTVFKEKKYGSKHIKILKKGQEMEVKEALDNKKR